MNKKQSICYGLFILIQSFAVSGSEFYETKEDIVKALKGEIKDLGKKRSLFASDKTRALKKKKTVIVMREDAKSGKKSKVSYTTGNEVGSTNMRIEFDVDSAVLRKTSYSLLSELGKALKDPDLKNKKLIIAGHTDNQGDNEYNMNLSLLRAHAVRYFLNKNYGINKHQLEVLGFGEENPLVINSSEVNRQMNRRVEIIHVKR